LLGQLLLLLLLHQVGCCAVPIAGRALQNGLCLADGIWHWQRGGCCCWDLRRGAGRAIFQQLPQLLCKFGRRLRLQLLPRRQWLRQLLGLQQLVLLLLHLLHLLLGEMRRGGACAERWRVVLLLLLLPHGRCLVVLLHEHLLLQGLVLHEQHVLLLLLLGG
jgi:hypothetical protein